MYIISHQHCYLVIKKIWCAVFWMDKGEGIFRADWLKFCVKIFLSWNAKWKMMCWFILKFSFGPMIPHLPVLLSPVVASSCIWWTGYSCFHSPITASQTLLHRFLWCCKPNKAGRPDGQLTLKMVKKQIERVIFYLSVYLSSYLSVYPSTYLMIDGFFFFHFFLKYKNYFVGRKFKFSPYLML